VSMICLPEFLSKIQLLTQIWKFHLEHQSDLYYLGWKHAMKLVPDWQRGNVILFLNSS
jgi:hypothetical protein